MADYDDLLQAARVGLPQCPDLVILPALQRAGARFFAATKAWEAELDPIELTAGDASADLGVDSDSRVLSVIDANLGNDSRTPVAVARWRDLAAMSNIDGTPRSLALHPTEYAIQVWPTPAESMTLIVRVALAPTLDADGVPDRMMDDWHAALIAAAKAELQATPSTPWYNQKESLRQERNYYEQEVAAKRDVMSGHGAPMRVRFRPFV